MPRQRVLVSILSYCGWEQKSYLPQNVQRFCQIDIGNYSAVFTGIAGKGVSSRLGHIFSPNFL